MNIAFLTLNILKSIFKVINHGMETYEDNSEFGIYTGDWCSDYYKTSDCELEDKEYVIRGGGAYFWPWQADEWIWCMSAM